MASPLDELATVDRFTPGLNLAGSPLTFQPGETDLADDVWFDLDGSAHARPPLTAVLRTMGSNVPASNTIDTVGLFGFGSKAAVVAVTVDANNPNATRIIRVDDLSPNAAPSSPQDVIWSQTNTQQINGTTASQRYRPTSYAHVETAAYVTQPDGQVWRISPGATNQAPVLLQSLTTSSTTGWNDDYENPGNVINERGGAAGASSGFPLANVILNVNAASTSWMFAAYATRVRWSHATSYTVTPTGLAIYGPQDWAINDFTDLATTGSIMAMAHYGDHVLVFTSSDTFGLYGSPPDDVSVVKHSSSAGTISPHSVAVGPEGVWFYSHPEGLYLWDGNQMTHVSEKLKDFAGQFTDEEPATLAKVAVGYKDRRVWLSVPHKDGPTTYMLDLRNGSWARHTYQATQFLHYDIGEAAGSLLAVLPKSTRGTESALAQVVEVGLDPDGGSDVLVGSPYATSGGDPVTVEWPVEAKLRVGPLGANVPDMRPRWRSCEVAGDELDDVAVSVDFDGSGYVSRELGPLRAGLRRFNLGVRGWRCTLLFEWTGAGRLVAVIARWWQGRREA